MTVAPVFRRVLIKLSGEGVSSQRDNISTEQLVYYAKEIQRVLSQGVQVAVVIGGGNIWRGNKAEKLGIDMAQSHYMGMVATVINALALQGALERLGIETRVMTAIRMDEIAEPYIRRKAIAKLDAGQVVIFAGGTGNPYFTTDSGAALRAAEIHADVILMAKSGVDGVYTADPKLDPKAERLEYVTFYDALLRGLTIMDSTALSFCKDNDISIVVFDASHQGAMEQIVQGEHIGTLVSNTER